MTLTAAQKTDPLTFVVEVDSMAIFVMLVSWIVKQQQLLKQQQELLEKELEKQERELEARNAEILQLKEDLDKLKNRSSQNSSVPPSQDLLKKPSDKSKRKKGKKRGPKYNHSGTTRNGFGEPDRIEILRPSVCPACGDDVEEVTGAPKKIQQVAELVEQPVEIREYQRGLCQCQSCGWSGYVPLPWGIKEGFSYGGRLSSVVGWLGYGGNLTWRKQEYFVEHVLGLPISQGSLAKMHRWFTESLEPHYQQWLAYVKKPGVRCVDETTYCIDGIKYWVWVATSDQVCVLLLAPTRSSAKLKLLLGENFDGILQRDCFSAYGPQIAAAKQKCLAYLERDLDALKTSRFAANVDFAQKIEQILWTARKAHQDYHNGLLRTEELQQKRPSVEAQLQAILAQPPVSGWPADAQRLANRLERHWNEWFTFLTHPEVKPDNNDAERALRPVVVHRKVSGGARSNWGAKLVAMMFSFLETMRLQGASAIASLCELLSLAGRGPPGLST